MDSESPSKNGIMPPEPSSPINNLPYELLADIMFLALIMPRSNTWLLAPADVLVLCRVCSHWRRVALHTPRLWALITLPIISRKEQMSLTATKMFLERSAPLPISVSVHNLIPRREVANLLPFLVSAAHRWNIFDMYHDREQEDFDSVVSLSTIPHRSLLYLERLYLRPPQLDSELTVFRSAPRLRDVTLRLRCLSSIPPMPWAQLTRLSLEYNSPQSVLDTLICCTNLLSARVVTEQWLESDSPDDVSAIAETVLLEHMEELDIFMIIRSTGEHLGPFLRRLQLPALKSLSLTLSIPAGDDAEWFVSWTVPEMISFLIRIPNLQCLSISNFLTAEDLEDVLRYTPALTELSFSKEAVDDEFFAALSAYPETNTAAAQVPLVSRLETLELTDVGVDFSETSIAEMIRSRWWSDDNDVSSPRGFARLQRMSLINHYLAPKNFTAGFREEMNEYCSQGLDL